MLSGENLRQFWCILWCCYLTNCLGNQKSAIFERNAFSGHQSAIRHLIISVKKNKISLVILV